MQFFEACALRNQWVKLWIVYGSRLWVPFTSDEVSSLAFQLLEVGLTALSEVVSQLTATPSSFGVSFQNLKQNVLV